MFKKNVFLCGMFVLMSGVLSAQNMVSPETAKLVNDTVYEVVLLKSTVDPFQYEKELPMDVLPFQIRNDKYIPIGTAFAVSKDRFMTASHVLRLESETMFSNLYIRDQRGNVFELDQIYRYSNRRDFVLFSVKGLTSEPFLSQNTNWEASLNQEVYAVGNALGEGIVIRSGLLTSRTPESVNGEWNWLRFSAAASPGNSGGPLINKDGELIGIVLAKNENENLNYALPISEVDQVKENTAVFKDKYRYKLINSKLTGTAETNFTYVLPRQYLEFRNILSGDYHRFTLKTQSVLLQEKGDRIFPNSKGSANLLNSYVLYNFPTFIAEDEDGNWAPMKINDIKSVELPNNGKINYVSQGNNMLLKMTKPDNIPLKTLLDDSELYMKLILRGMSIQRNIGNEQVRITSMGKSAERFFYSDHYGRKWLVQIWNFNYSDEKLLTITLPMPDGFFALMAFASTDFINNEAKGDFLYLLDFVSLSYYGVFSNWTEFLNLRDYIPNGFQKFSLKYQNGQIVVLQTPRFSFNYDTHIFNITDSSDLRMNFGYFRSQSHVTWDVTSFFIWEDKNNNNIISLKRQLKPEEGLNNDMYLEWNKIIDNKYPYDETTSMDNGITYMGSAGVINSFTNLAYTIMLGFEGNNNLFFMKNKIRQVKDDFQILEK